MRFLIVHSVYFLLLMLLCVACGDRTPVVELTDPASTRMKENMINANKVVIQSEATQIEAYVARRGWATEVLPCGACLYGEQKGSTPIQPEDKAIVTYRLEALDGASFYTRQVDTVVVGQLQPTVALDQALGRLRYGSQAWLIAPSGAAYGAVGDGDRVPPRTVLVYHLLKIEKS